MTGRRGPTISLSALRAQDEARELKAEKETIEEQRQRELERRRGSMFSFAAFTGANRNGRPTPNNFGGGINLKQFFGA